MKKYLVSAILPAALLFSSSSFAVVQTANVAIVNNGQAIKTTSLTLTIRPAPRRVATPARAGRSSGAGQRVRVRRAPKPVAVIRLKPTPAGAYNLRYDDERIRSNMVVDVSVTLPGGRRVVRRDVPLASIVGGAPFDLAALPTGAPPAPPPAGTPAFSPQPVRAAAPSFGCGVGPTASPCFFVGPSYRSRRIPTIAAGTMFDVGLGTEVGYASGASRLHGVGAGASFSVPFNGFSLFFDAEFTPFRDNRRAAGIPNGGDNVAFTFLFPNPVTTSTGVLFGATGQDAIVSTSGSWGEINAGFNVPFSTIAGYFGSPSQASAASQSTLTPFVRLGATISFLGADHSIRQSSVAFANHWMNTSLKSDQYLIAPVFGLGVNAALGANVDANLVASVAPGIRIFDGSADQQVSCPFCPLPGDRAFGLSQSLSDSWFAYRASIGANVNVNFSERFFGGATIRYDYYSATGYIRNPITPAQQPVSIGKKSTSGVTAMGTLGVRY